MYKEIEDLLKDSMKINTMFDKQKENIEPEVDEKEVKETDPLQGIEDGLEKVNNILKNVINDKNNSSFHECNRSNLSKYLNFHSNTPNEDSDTSQEKSKGDCNSSLDISDPKRKIVFTSELDSDSLCQQQSVKIFQSKNTNELHQFLTSSKEYEDSFTLLSSPNLKDKEIPKLNVAHIEKDTENIKSKNDIQGFGRKQSAKLKYLNNQNFTPVEQRLFNINKKYSKNKENLKAYLTEKELKEVKHKPEINKNCEKFIHRDNLNPFSQSKTYKKIEDRLLERHKIKQKEQELKSLQEEKKIKEMARPKLLSGTKTNGNINTFISKKLNSYIVKSENTKQQLMK